MNRPCLFLFGTFLPFVLQAVPGKIVIVHTSEIHSNFLGHEPTMDYSPEVIGNDATLGGVARLATLIQQVKRKHGEETFVLDAGDFSMGSPPALLFRSHAFEIRMLALLGYDAAALGEHEFMLGSTGLASSALAAERLSPLPLPALLTSNLNLRDGSAGHDEAFSRAPFAERAVVQRGQIRLGVFGVMAADTGLSELEFPDGVRASDPVFAARIAVQRLQEEKVDAVVCLCHMTMERAAEIARAVPGIDVIVAGHGGRAVPRPILVNRTWIVHSGKNGTHAGVLRLRRRNHAGLDLEDYQLRTLDDSTAGSGEIVRAVGDFAQESALILRARGIDGGQVLAHTQFDLEVPPRSSALGFLCADALFVSARRSTAAGALQVNGAVGLAGSIDAPIRRGRTGIISAADAFRVTPFGSGPDGEVGSPIVAFSLDGRDLRTMFEILLLGAEERDDLFPAPAGIRVETDPARVPLDRVTALRLETAAGWSDIPRKSGPPYYKIAMTLHNVTKMLNETAGFPGFFKVIPRQDDGTPIRDLRTTILDADPALPGIQEIKEWQSFRSYLQSLPDQDGDGISDIPRWVLDPPPRLIVETHGIIRFLADPGPLTATAGIGALAAATGLILIGGSFVRTLISTMIASARSFARRRRFRIRGSS